MTGIEQSPGRRRKRVRNWHFYVRNGDGKIELCGKGLRDGIWGINFDGRPAHGIGVRTLRGRRETNNRSVP